MDYWVCSLWTMTMVLVHVVFWSSVSLTRTGLWLVFIFFVVGSGRALGGLRPQQPKPKTSAHHPKKLSLMPAPMQRMTGSSLVMESRVAVKELKACYYYEETMYFCMVPYVVSSYREATCGMASVLMGVLVIAENR